jgi:hypothetical protein
MSAYPDKQFWRIRRCFSGKGVIRHGNPQVKNYCTGFEENEMTELRQQMNNVRRLRGLADRTRESYIARV